MRVVSTVLALAVALSCAGRLLAADNEKGQCPAEKTQKRAGNGPLAFLKGLDLTADQENKVSDLVKEYKPKFQGKGKIMEGILTPEQKKARDEARKTAKAAGKNRKEIHEAVLAAINLTDAQKTKLDEARKAAEATRKEFRQKVMDILTPAQKDKLKARQQRRKAKESAKPAKPAETNQSY